MKILKNCIKLSSQVRIYIPSTVNVDEVDDSSHSVWISRTLSFLSKEFGGATASSALGAWNAKNGSLVKENISIVFSYATTGQLEESIQSIYDFCLMMKKDLNQESVALEVNGDLYLI